MICWTLFSYVLLALSPGASAESMEISPDCDTSGPNGPDWESMAGSAFGLMELIPGLGNFISAGENIVGIWEAAENEDNGFAKQWETCIKGWITTAIDDKSRRETMSILESMGDKINTILGYMMKNGPLNNFEYGKIDSNIQSLQDKADEIKSKISGTNKPLDGVIAYDAALYNELFTAYAFIVKLNNTIPESGYRSHILKDIAGSWSFRMKKEYRKNIQYINETGLNYDGKHPFWDDWGINMTKSLDRNWNYKCVTQCNVHDPTFRTGNDDGLTRTSYMCLPWMVNKDIKACMAKCNRVMDKKTTMMNNAKHNVRKLLDGMEAAVETAIKHFDDLSNIGNMELLNGKDCASECLGSIYDVKCLTKCHLEFDKEN